MAVALCDVFNHQGFYQELLCEKAVFGTGDTERLRDVEFLNHHPVGERGDINLELRDAVEKVMLPSSIEQIQSGQVDVAREEEDEHSDYLPSGLHEVRPVAPVVLC